MEVGRWNPEKHRYDPYELPEGARVYVKDLGEEIMCAGCGRPVIAANTYTSRLIHSLQTTFGFMVCEECYREERDRDIKKIQ